MLIARSLVSMSADRYLRVACWIRLDLSINQCVDKFSRLQLIGHVSAVEKMALYPSPPGSCTLR